MKKIVVVGSLNVDYVVDVRHMPAVGETVLAENFSITPGGKGANQAFALGRMGADVVMLGAVGKDANGDFEVESLKSADVKADHIARTVRNTGLALISVNEEGDNNIIVVQGANLDVTREYIDSKIGVLQEADIVLLQLEIPLDTVMYVAKIAKEMGKLVILDPAPAPPSLPKELLTNVDIIKPNEIELMALTSLSGGNIKAACEVLLNKGVGCVLASLGEKGAYAAPAESEYRSVSGEKVTTVDTTAAGDSFTAAVAFALAKEKSIYQAMEFANKTAAIVVSRKGAQSSIPTREEIDNIWNEL